MRLRKEAGGAGEEVEQADGEEEVGSRWNRGVARAAPRFVSVNAAP